MRMRIDEHANKQRWLAGLCLTFVVLLSFLPAHWKMLLHTKGHLHDAAHMLVFGGMAFLLARCARTREGEIGLLVLAAALGVLIEFAQDFELLLPRGSWSPVEWNDILLDTIAVLVAGVVQMGIVPLLRRPSLRLDRSPR